MTSEASQNIATSRLRWGLLAVCFGGLVGTYSVVNHAMADGGMARQLPTWVDGRVPFYAPAVAVYLAIYALTVVPLCLVSDRRVLLRGAGAYTTLLAAGVPFWIVWPVTVPRTPVPVVDLWTWGVAVMRWADPPLNCFPSMHVGETILASLMCARLDRAVGVGMGALALLVWWSTLALDQHWFVDGVFGAGLAVAVDAVWFRRRPLPAAAWQSRSRWYLLAVGALYLALFGAGTAPWLLGLAQPADVGAVAG